MRFDGKLPEEVAKEGGTPTIHNVHILDASGSMTGGKYINALAGINQEIEDMRKDGEGVTQTIIEFDSGHTGKADIKTHYFMTPAVNCYRVTGKGADGGTPLYQTVGETIEKILTHMKSGDKVLLKVFTDGEENSSQGKYRNIGSSYNPKSEELTKLIKMVEDNHNFTVTFIGTERDVQHMVHNIGLMASNTMSHMNTPESINTSYSMSRGATVAYRKAMYAGASQDELKGNFFKRVVPEQKKKEEEKKDEKTTN